jgi:membrane-bound lytic murein transglycosylase D
MNHLEEHQIKPRPAGVGFSGTDTLNIHYAASFEQIASHIDVPVETLEKLNPVYRRNFIPNMSEPATLILPKDKVVAFLKKENQIFKSKPMASASGDSNPNLPEDQGKKKLIHTVNKGEYFHKIAMKYQCTIDQIRRWNDLPDNNLQVGQKLEIWVDPEYVKQQEEERMEMKKQNVADTNKRVVFYTVQKGDTIWKIANKFNCESITDLIQTNDIHDETDLKPGKQLKIYLDH